MQWLIAKCTYLIITPIAVSGMVQLVWSGLQLRQIFQCFSVRMIVIVRLPSLNCE